MAARAGAEGRRLVNVDSMRGKERCAGALGRHGRVWLNPPFDRYKVGRWIGRLADHGDGTALLHACTETEWFRICWQNATAILFMAKRLIFVKPDGTPCTTKGGEVANSGAPPVLVAFGDYDAVRLRKFAAEHGGSLVERWLFNPLAICS